MKIKLIYKIIPLLFVVILLVDSCKPSKKKDDKKGRHTKTEIKYNTILQTAEVSREMQRLLPVLYQQRSGEYRGLCYQAFQLGRLLLVNDLKDDKVISKRAVVLDVDETVLDNSPMEARCIRDNVDYSAIWDEWCNKSQAAPLPGAVEFLAFARRYGVEVFYVTNRDEKLREVTAANIKKAGLPLKSDEFLVMKQEESSKEGRRKAIEEHYHISLLFGDNLNDFSKVFEHRTADDRMKATDSLKTQFGSRFILLPNAMYGDWDRAILGYQKDLPLKDEIQLHLNALKPD